MPEVGVYGMSITPFTLDGAIDEAVLRAHLRFMSAGGVGVYVASQGSGEGDLLTLAEKAAVYRIAADELRGITPVIAAGIGLAGSTAQIRDVAIAAEAAGVDAVQVLGPRPGPLPPREDELEAYFRAIVGDLRVDVHLSHNAVLTGYGLPFGLVERLVADYPHIRAINVSDRSSEALHAYVAGAVERFGARVPVRIGVTSQAAAAHGLGARGLLCFEANVAPALVARVWAALNRGETEELPVLLALNAALARGGNPRSLKAALAILGRDGGFLRAPYLPLPAAEYEELAGALLALGLGEGS